MSHSTHLSSKSQALDQKDRYQLDISGTTFGLARQHLLVTRSRHGLGCFAKKGIPKGAVITHIEGEIFVSHHRTHPPFGVDSFYDNLIQIENNEYLMLLDPIRRFNHSCTPNTGFRNKTFTALRRIDRHEEICFDYSTCIDENDRWQMPCQCFTKDCRQLIGDFIKLPFSIQEGYLKAEIVMPFIVKKYFRNFPTIKLHK